MVLDYFREITQIERCSGDTQKMMEFLVSFCKKQGYRVKTDLYGNILATSSNPKICFQAHYDMVCIGDYKKIEIIEDSGYLKAKNSTLGADNGIGIAIMMNLMREYKNLEFLFTNDEEIGLIGAMNLNLTPKAKKLINLDSEDENIYIGCAGGFDVEISIPTKTRPYFGEVYSIKIDNLPGGHSGVDIDKNYPNAIKEVVKLLKDNFTLLSIKGGERRNSIPRECEALIISQTKLKYPKITTKGKMILSSKLLIKLLKSIHHGILGYDSNYQVVSKSLNLAIVNDTKVVLSARANSKELMEELKLELKNFFELVGVEYFFVDEYPAWKTVETPLAKMYQKISGKNLKVIHAGLEPAILGDKFEQMISIGPNIYEPHSLRERVQIESIYKLEKEIRAFLELLNIS
jgi:dipeptidase D